MPTDRHTATGTCEIGHSTIMPNIMRVNSFAIARVSCAQKKSRTGWQARDQNDNGGHLRCPPLLLAYAARSGDQHVLELPWVALIHVLREQHVAINERVPVGVVADHGAEIGPLQA